MLNLSTSSSLQYLSTINNANGLLILFKNLVLFFDNDLYDLPRTPSLNSIRQMIMKRGHIKTEKGHLPLTDNKLVEDALGLQCLGCLHDIVRKLMKYSNLAGEHNIICIEDIIHEIATLGPHFKDVNALIWHVKLNPPTKGWKKLARPFGKGGDFGSRGDKINSLLQTMI